MVMLLLKKKTLPSSESSDDEESGKKSSPNGTQGTSSDPDTNFSGEEGSSPLHNSAADDDSSSSSSSSASSESSSSSSSSDDDDLDTTSNPSTTHSESASSTTNSGTDRIAKKETIHVNRSKCMVYLALLFAAAGMATAAYFLVATQHQREFESDFKAVAKEVHANAQANAHNVFGQMHSLSTTLTSYAISANVDWPYVTLRHFDLRAAEAEALSGAEVIAFSPVVSSKVNAWENYSWYNQGWIYEDLSYREDELNAGNISRRVYDWSESPLAGMDASTRRRTQKKNKHRSSSSFVLPLWQMGPVPSNASIVNLDLYSHPSFHRMVNDVLEIKHKLLSEVVDLNFLLKNVVLEVHPQRQRRLPVASHDGHPRSYVLQPVFEDFRANSPVVGMLIAVLPWQSFFVDLLPEGTNGLDVDVKDTCGSEFTYVINGHNASFYGQGDLHDPKYEHLAESYDFAPDARYDGGDMEDDELVGVHCEYTIQIYPSVTFHAPYQNNLPVIYSMVVLLVFLCTILTFAFYDWFVQRRQRRVMSTAKHTSKIVSSLFPKTVQKRILEEAKQQAAMEEAAGKNKKLGTSFKSKFVSNRMQLRDFLGAASVVESGGTGGEEMRNILSSKPIADFFPSTTIMFADLVGFTAWSSTREPAQVFTLLETIYHHFDEIARRRRVFKVETVGDCYVAVSGLPEPRGDHATIMARFARDCLYKLYRLLKQLEVSLGPDTADLGLRAGLHSGPVTAGVLRGERSRFQLFGDTINTTSRIESTGERNKIHVSSETANHLITSGKGHWLSVREDRVTAKGKGELKTYWLELRGDTARSTTSGSSDSAFGDEAPSESNLLPSVPEHKPRSGSMSAMQSAMHTSFSGALPHEESAVAKYARLVDWNTEVMITLLKKIVARRECIGASADPESKLEELEMSKVYKDYTVLDEVEDIVTLPKFNARAARVEKSEDDVQLDAAVIEQLRSYIQTIATMYRDNSFHCYQHASHVTMSVVKLLGRIVAPDLEDDEDCVANTQQDANARTASTLHDHTYGITSDPLTQFAVVYSAMIHDVDHPGVPNSQLIKEQATVAVAYKSQSVAEQNSVDLAWDLLMDPSYADLRRTIYHTKAEFLRFRQLVVNTVMATDIMDKDLNARRKARWDLAFSDSSTCGDHESKGVCVNRKATIVIEHLIQASDVAHTMQHWLVYRKWNAKLFAELRCAWREGRAEKDPAENWYQGEIGFFDFYIIPLAKKLKDCGVFGVSSDEYLNYAQKNRQEWETNGQAIVAEMIENEERQYAGGW